MPSNTKFHEPVVIDIVFVCRGDVSKNEIVKHNASDCKQYF